jgi:hypothetical protein
MVHTPMVGLREAETEEWRNGILDEWINPGLDPRSSILDPRSSILDP